MCYGLPFASPNRLYDLSKMSVWLLRLGIAIERIKPGTPTQNGRHERMYLTLKKEATRPPGANSLQQQARFDAFVSEFNTNARTRHSKLSVPRSSMAPPTDPTAACRRSTIPCTIATSSSPPAGASACTARRSTSQACSPVRGLE